MEIGGWIMLVLMWGGVIVLGIYCFWKILMSEEENSQL